MYVFYLEVSLVKRHLDFKETSWLGKTFFVFVILDCLSLSPYSVCRHRFSSFHHLLPFLILFQPSLLHPIRTPVSPSCDTTSSARREEHRSVCRFLRRRAGGAQRADRQLLLLQQEIRQHRGSVEISLNCMWFASLWWVSSLWHYSDESSAHKLNFIQMNGLQTVSASFLFFMFHCIKVLMSGHRRPWKIMPKTRGHISIHENSWRMQRRMTSCGTELRYNIYSKRQPTDVTVLFLSKAFQLSLWLKHMPASLCCFLFFLRCLSLH